MIFQTIFTVALVTAASIANAYVIERQTQGAQFYNNTVVCGQAVFGGCCAGTLDEYGNNASCYNATLAAYDVGGSTMGIQSKYACLNDKTSNAANVYRALCCKYMQFYVNPVTTSPKFLSCAPPNDAV